VESNQGRFEDESGSFWGHRGHSFGRFVQSLSQQNAFKQLTKGILWVQRMGNAGAQNAFIRQKNAFIRQKNAFIELKEAILCHAGMHSFGQRMHSVSQQKGGCGIT
jgi:hypothetical protein